MNSEEPKPEPEVAEPAETAEVPPPPPPQEPEKPVEDIWKEDYDELVEPDKPTKPRKPRHWGGIIVVVALILIIVIWTVMSPKVLPAQSDTYISSPTYASLGDFSGYRNTWAGNTTWGLAINGSVNGSVNEPMLFKVLLTKVSEKNGNWFLRGTSIELRNVSIFLKDGTFLGSMTNHTNLGFGILANVPVTFTSAGSFDLYVYAKFLVYEDMRIGFIPLEMVNIPMAEFGVQIDIA